MQCKWVATGTGACTNMLCPYFAEKCNATEHPEACKYSRKRRDVRVSEARHIDTSHESQDYARANMFLSRLRRNSVYMTVQQFRTLKGQALAGHLELAEAGLQSIIHKTFGGDM